MSGQISETGYNGGMKSLPLYIVSAYMYIYIYIYISHRCMYIYIYIYEYGGEGRWPGRECTPSGKRQSEDLKTRSHTEETSLQVRASLIDGHSQKVLVLVLLFLSRNRSCLLTALPSAGPPRSRVFGSERWGDPKVSSCKFNPQKLKARGSNPRSLAAVTSERPLRIRSSRGLGSLLQIVARSTIGSSALRRQARAREAIGNGMCGRPRERARRAPSFVLLIILIIIIILQPS